MSDTWSLQHSRASQAAHVCILSDTAEAMNASSPKDRGVMKVLRWWQMAECVPAGV